ncbi:TPA: ATP-binding protein, partial [Legionella pneumophila]
SYNCFSNIHPDSFKRVLSNLINNGIEAVNSNGSIIISLTCNATHVEIIIEDNGCGIPRDILPKVTEQGFSFNKKTGAGFGLSYAKQYLEQINGSMHIHSEEKVGTKIQITLIRSTPPSWFCDSMNIRHGTNIVVLDDDISIHDAWNERFSNISHVKMFHFYNAIDLLQYKVDPEIPVLYLVDYELLADVKNGLDVIEELNLNGKAILVTSCFEDIAIRNRCENIGVKIIPKSYVPYIKIIETPKKEHINTVVFIDDDEMMRMTWIFAAEEAGQCISTYSSFDEFINEINNYGENTLIYIDSDLGNNVRGEDCAKLLFDKGFIDVHLATGHSRDRFSQMPWIKSIVGKEPPFRFAHGNLT